MAEVRELGRVRECPLVGQQDVGKPSEASIAESTNFTLSGSQTGHPEIAKLRPVEVVNRKLSRFGPETAEKSLVLLRYTHTDRARTHNKGGAAGRLLGRWAGSIDLNERPQLRTVVFEVGLAP
jgi:hypothetical protein